MQRAASSDDKWGKPMNKHINELTGKLIGKT